MRFSSAWPVAFTFVSLFSAMAGAADLAAHRAEYVLEQQQVSGTVSAASGTMSYEVQDACDGWAVNQRLDLSVTNTDGQKIQLVSEYVTWESKDGHKFRFNMRQTTDGAVTSETAGDATTTADGGEVHYTAPKQQTVTLPRGTLLPMAHTNITIETAHAGKKFIAVPLFDGTSDAGAQDTSITVQDTKPAGAEGKQWPPLATLPSEHVHIAFFDRKGDTPTPEYEVGMRYWDNGVGDDMLMDFSNFVVHGTLTSLKLLPHQC
jgi:hypothetical protein